MTTLASWLLVAMLFAAFVLLIVYGPDIADELAVRALRGWTRAERRRDLADHSPATLDAFVDAQQTEYLAAASPTEPPWEYGIDTDGCWLLDHKRGVHSPAVITAAMSAQFDDEGAR